MKCFYHSADLDGHCAGALIKYRYPECEMVGINYGQEFPWDTVEQDERVFMVDFSLQPFAEMERLRDLADLTWIDHHKTALDEATSLGFWCDGKREVGKAACELTWEYMFGSQPMPEAVRLLGRYDVWDHSDPRTLHFQWGMRQFVDTCPDNQKWWRTWFTASSDLFGRKALLEVLESGQILLSYQTSENTKFCRAYAFETKLPVDFLDNDGYRTRGVYNAIACNKGFTNSQLFESVFDPDKHHLMITFCRMKLPARRWTVSLYTTKPEIDCGAIAKAFGGGGHKGAAGFQCENLPFEF